MQDSFTPFGLNIIGYASANIGLGHSLREYVAAIRDRHVPVTILDLDAGFGRSKLDNPLQHLTVTSAELLSHPINLSIISGLDFDHVLYPPQGLKIHDRLNAAFVWWEITDIPDYWKDAGQIFDVLIAGSDFVQATLQTCIPGIPVLLAPHPIRMPASILPDRPRFGLPEDALLIYTGFDPGSDPVRKNPFGAVEAFKCAFPDQSHIHLVIKVNNHNIEGERLQLLEKMYEIIHGNSRIHLIQASLPYTELLSLYASCDIFLSLHRAEGLGLVPLEAMRLGKAVVATGWSGNMSYMNYRNACLVRSHFTMIDDNSYSYSPKNLGIKGFWAEPEIDHAVAWLRKLAQDEAFRSAIGRCAALDSAHYNEQAEQMTFLDDLRAIWENRDLYLRKDKQVLMQKARQSLEKDKLRRMPGISRYIEQARKGIVRELDRHLLWRFRSENQ